MGEGPVLGRRVKTARGGEPSGCGYKNCNNAFFRAGTGICRAKVRLSNEPTHNLFACIVVEL